MSLKEKEDALFRRWRKHRPKLVPDGCVDESVFHREKRRVVFLMKEVNDPAGEHSWDLREYLRKGARGHTWNNVTRWISAVRNPRRDWLWSELDHIDADRRRRDLTAAVVMNVKKEGGAGSSVAASIERYAEEDVRFLGEQFALYRPDLVIACGVDAAAVPQLSDCAWRRTRRGVLVGEPVQGGTVIAYHHPQARYPDHLMFFGLLDAVREVSAE